MMEVQSMCLRSKKRTLELFLGNYGVKYTSPAEILAEKQKFKIDSEYASVKDIEPKPAKEVSIISKEASTKPSKELSLVSKEPTKSATDLSIILRDSGTKTSKRDLSLALARENLKPEWHHPWKLMRVISGHLGWVRSIAVDPSNEWFVTGAADRTIKIWDLASGVLKLTLTGHINAVRGLAVSARHPYLFSCGEDKMVKCWDLEVNKVIRHYHGHLSGVYCLSLHPTIDVLITGGRDSTARVWDIRTKGQVHVLTGHTNTVGSIVSQSNDPQVVTGSMDSTIRTWDLAKGTTINVLTHHKKSVRALALHPSEPMMVSASPDNIKQWQLPETKFLKNLSGHSTIIHTLSVNKDNVLVSGGDNGSLYFWDWKSGYNFQKIQTTVQPGSLESEAGIFASAFDMTGSRLITCEADKTIKVYKEDDNATPETHPIDKNWRPTKQIRYN